MKKQSKVKSLRSKVGESRRVRPPLTQPVLSASAGRAKWDEGAEARRASAEQWEPAADVEAEIDDRPIQRATSAAAAAAASSKRPMSASIPAPKTREEAIEAGNKAAAMFDFWMLSRAKREKNRELGQPGGQASGYFDSRSPPRASSANAGGGRRPPPQSRTAAMDLFWQLQYGDKCPYNEDIFRHSTKSPKERERDGERERGRGRERELEGAAPSVYPKPRKQSPYLELPPGSHLLPGVAAAQHQSKDKSNRAPRQRLPPAMAAGAPAPALSSGRFLDYGDSLESSLASLYTHPEAPVGGGSSFAAEGPTGTGTGTGTGSGGGGGGGGGGGPSESWDLFQEVTKPLRLPSAKRPPSGSAANAEASAEADARSDALPQSRNRNRSRSRSPSPPGRGRPQSPEREQWEPPSAHKPVIKQHEYQRWLVRSHKSPPRAEQVATLGILRWPAMEQIVGPWHNRFAAPRPNSPGLERLPQSPVQEGLGNGLGPRARKGAGADGRPFSAPAFGARAGTGTGASSGTGRLSEEREEEVVLSLRAALLLASTSAQPSLTVLTTDYARPAQAPRRPRPADGTGAGTGTGIGSGSAETITAAGAEAAASAAGGGWSRPAATTSQQRPLSGPASSRPTPPAAASAAGADGDPRAPLGVRPSTSTGAGRSLRAAAATPGRGGEGGESTPAAGLVSEQHGRSPHQQQHQHQQQQQQQQQQPSDAAHFSVTASPSSPFPALAPVPTPSPALALALALGLSPAAEAHAQAQAKAKAEADAQAEAQRRAADEVEIQERQQRIKAVEARRDRLRERLLELEGRATRALAEATAATAAAGKEEDPAPAPAPVSASASASEPEPTPVSASAPAPAPVAAKSAPVSVPVEVAAPTAAAEAAAAVPDSAPSNTSRPALLLAIQGAKPLRKTRPPDFTPAPASASASASASHSDAEARAKAKAEAEAEERQRAAEREAVWGSYAAAVSTASAELEAAGGPALGHTLPQLGVAFPWGRLLGRGKFSANYVAYCPPSQEQDQSSSSSSVRQVCLKIAQFQHNDPLMKAATSSEPDAPVRLLSSSSSADLIASVGGGSGNTLVRPKSTPTNRKSAPPAAVQDEFLREARALAACRHPCIVELLDVLLPPSPIGLVLELMVGGSLAGALGHPLWASVSQQQKMGLMKGVTRGLARMHALGFVHRDLKPHNILLGPRVLPAVLDEAAGLKRSASGSWLPVEDTPRSEAPTQTPRLGAPASTASTNNGHSPRSSASASLAVTAARQLGWALDDKSFLEETNESYMLSENWVVAKIGDLGTAVQLSPDSGTVTGVVGTTGYVAPEVLRDEPYGLAADIFSLAVVVCELFAEQPPASSNPLVGATCADFPTARPSLGPGHPPLISAICKKAWQLEAELRPSALQLCGVLKVSVDE